MKRKAIFFTLFLNFTFLFAQEEITAKVTIDENSNLQVTQIFKENNRDTYLFHKNISLNPKEATFIKEKGNLKEYEIQNVSNLNFEVITNTSKLNNDFLITNLKYTGTKSKDFFDLKKFNLYFSSKKYDIVFPSKDDLKETYTTSPKIVAGNFNYFEENGFKVYYLENEKEHLEEMKKANIGMSNAFNYYSKYFGEKRKPKIVFAPNNEASETTENLIVYNSDVIKGKNKENTISHEIAHIWFGQDGLIIKERPLTEGIAEFLSMQYVISQLGEKQLDISINERLYQLEGEKSLHDLQDKDLDLKTSKSLSYRLLPMYFHSRQLRNPNFINELASLYKVKEKERKTSLEDINKFFETKEIEIISTDEFFPDFFISECSPNEVCITSNSEKEYDVELGIVDSNNQKSLKTLSFSKEQKEQKINIENINRIVIDPSYKILQVSRLNDVWSKNDNNVFNRNRYFKINSKEDIAFISNEVANYLSRKAENISNKISVSAKEKNELKELRNNNSKKIMTGGVTSYAEKNNSLFLFFAFNDENTNETTVLKMILKLDLEKTSIIAVKAEK
ncbi:MAG: hypothetical protein O9282_09230 [Flavobacterium sp.]|jgi:hypothetical protein|uniref:hypothetical protein n=1 Tax=Flavobacterium sp. TaxID=239 RepID=UPI0022CCA470|nr:hypothetical protein [Flavobacterium sp.]MCZ8090630.1 hypothetical protein [Flavobacterium sp.]MCZ8331479.1 hypothetical protein [Flavobacterium sp.]